MFTEIVGDANASDSFGVVRLLPNGSLDPNFGTGGATRMAFGNFDATPNALALQPDGKIVVFGQGALLAQWAAARFNANGTLDNGFGANGTLETDIPGFQSGAASVTTVVVDSGNGAILVGGSGKACTKCITKTILARYNPDSSLDQTFGSGGTVAVAAVGAPDAFALLSNGDILAAGSGAVAEFGPNGALHSGVTSTTTGATIVASTRGGPTTFETNGDFVFGSFSPVFDFGLEGAPGGSDRSLAAQPNGRIVIGGSAGQAGTSDFAVARFNANGGLDAAFGNGGKVTTAFPNASVGIRALVLQPEGRVVAVGTEIVNGGGPANLVAARYLGQ